jgi:microcystin-dependent protein
MESFIGTIMMFAGNFAPLGWALCDGTLLSIAQNAALFSILGTTFGGNGQTNFALPDLRGRVPIHQGQGPGLSSYALGEAGGTENVTLTTTQIPPHAHTTPSHTHSFAAPASTGRPTGTSPASAVPAAATANFYASAANAAMLAGTTANDGAGNSGVAGSGVSHTNLQPFLGVNFIICLQGIFPSRS